MEFPIRFRKSISRELKSSPPLIEPSSEMLIHRFIVSDAYEWSLTFPYIIPKVVFHTFRYTRLPSRSSPSSTSAHPFIKVVSYKYCVQFRCDRIQWISSLSLSLSTMQRRTHLETLQRIISSDPIQLLQLRS